MNRRRFLELLGLGAAVGAATVFDPERLLWVPGAKRIFDMGGVERVKDWTVDIELGRTFETRRSEVMRHFNRLLTPEIITMQALRNLQESLVLERLLTRRYEDDVKFYMGDQWPIPLVSSR